jgi:hypothetical protein
MSESSRISVILRSGATIRKSFIAPYRLSSTTAPPLIALIDNVYFFPLTWRKFIVDTCRIQQDPFSNAHLLHSYNQLVETTRVDIPYPNSRIHSFYSYIETKDNMSNPHWFDIFSFYHTDSDDQGFLDDLSTVMSAF